MVIARTSCKGYYYFFFSSRRRHTRFDCDWSSDVCSSDLSEEPGDEPAGEDQHRERRPRRLDEEDGGVRPEREERRRAEVHVAGVAAEDVPCRRDDDILKNDVAREVDIRVHAERSEEDPGPDDGQADEQRAGGPRHLSPEEPGRSHRERDQENAERHGERPGGAEERGHQALRHAEDDGGHERPRDAAHAAQDRDREHPADVVAVGRLHHGCDRDEERAGQARGRDADAEGDGLDPDRIRSEEHTSELQSQSNLVCRLLLEKKKKNTPYAYRFTVRPRVPSSTSPQPTRQQPHTSAD